MAIDKFAQVKKDLSTLMHDKLHVSNKALSIYFASLDNPKQTYGDMLALIPKKDKATIVMIHDTMVTLHNFNVVNGLPIESEDTVDMSLCEILTNSFKKSRLFLKATAPGADGPTEPVTTKLFYIWYTLVNMASEFDIPFTYVIKWMRELYTVYDISTEDVTLLTSTCKNISSGMCTPKINSTLH